jgi:hypothetical protein
MWRRTVDRTLTDRVSRIGTMAAGSDGVAARQSNGLSAGIGDLLP